MKRRTNGRIILDGKGWREQNALAHLLAFLLLQLRVVCFADTKHLTHTKESEFKSESALLVFHSARLLTHRSLAKIIQVLGCDYFRK